MNENRALEMLERKEPRFVRFKPGDMVEGILVKVERIQVGEKPTLRYTIKCGGQLSSFLGTYQINEKLMIGDRGRWVRVECLGDDAKVVRSGRQMRVFRVHVSRHVVDEEAARGARVPSSEENAARAHPLRNEKDAQHGWGTVANG